MNWRIIVGVILLSLGVSGLYSVMSNNDILKLSMAPSNVKTACIVWMAVGVFLVLRGLKKK